LQSLRALSVMAAVVLAITLTIAAIGVHQGLSPTVCYQRGAETGTAAGEVMDGRSCENHKQCEEGGIPGAEYLCEHAGLLGTHSIGGRVRFRGLLEDPNELCMAISLALPLALAFYERRRNGIRLLLLLVSFVLCFTCAIMTRSRSGQMSLIAALAVYFARRLGKRGLIIGAVLALPLLALGGRSGTEADSSSEERLECWVAAFDMWRDYPLFGVGQGQFGEHHYLTAHNSFLLALAEMGPVGLMLWMGTLYASLKTTLGAQRHLRDRPEAVDARIWATALLASQASLVISAFFLSLTYHTILWMFLGMGVAFAGAVQLHEPDWKVRFGWKDLFAVAGLNVAMLAGMQLYLRYKGI
jgi:hypothetical protein